MKLPDWFVGFREHQEATIKQIVDLFEDGADVVILDAPTGSGKTLIAECVRQMLRENGVINKTAYVCTSKELQDQFITDFPYGKVLKGRANYPTLSGLPDITCDDCTNTKQNESTSAECSWCQEPAHCPYYIAKKEAILAELAVVNTAYWMTEGNYAGQAFGHKDFVVIDECDTLEKELMGFVEYGLTDYGLRELGIRAPGKGVHKKTVLEWLEKDLIPSVKYVLDGMKGFDVKALRKRRRLGRLLETTKMLLVQLAENGDTWIRDYEKPLLLKPVMVDWAGERYIWSRGDKFLLMSATVISSDEMQKSLGMDGLRVETVHHPMMFPKENRPIIVAGVANVVNKEEDEAVDKLVVAIAKIAEAHPNQRILVHTVSYRLAQKLHRRAPRSNSFIYTSSSEKKAAVKQYAYHEDGIIYAPSLERGTDFRDDLCRVIVVAKVPFPYLGDRQISTRMRLPGGREWYMVQTIRSIVQMTGRGVRSETDYATTYILDQQFMGNVYKSGKNLFPSWWTEAIDFTYPTINLKK